MFRPFSLYVGLRNFTSGSSNRLVSFISLLAILGLVLGVALLIVVSSIMNGFDHEMESRILGAIPHVRLFKEGGVDDVSSLITELETQENVRAAMPFAQVEGMLTSRGKTRPVEMLGVDGALSGEFNQISPKLSVFTVAGIFETHTTIDQHIVLAQLEVVGVWAGTHGLPQGMQIKLNDIFQVRQTGFDLLRALPSGYRFSDWIQTHGNLYQAIKMSRNMVSLLVFLIIGIAVFNVISMLMMTVIDKRSAIAILKTLGATNGEIIAVFLTQGFLIGAVGSLLGALIGIGCAWNASAIVSGIESLMGFHFLNSEVYPIDYLPSELVWGDVLSIIVVALGLNFLATLYPAVRAARTRPAEVLRYE